MRVGVKIGDWLQHILHHGTRVSGKRDTRIAGEVQPEVVCVRRDEVAHQKKITYASDIHSLARLLRRYRSYKRRFAPGLQSSTSCSGIQWMQHVHRTRLGCSQTKRPPTSGKDKIPLSSWSPQFSQSLENRNLKKKENKRTKQLVDGGGRGQRGEESQSVPDAAPVQQEGVTTTPANGKDWTMNGFSLILL